MFIGYCSAVEQNLPQPIKQETCGSLTMTCANCSFVTLMSVQYPNNIVAMVNENMTKDGSVFNYTFCNTSLAGQYIYNTYGDPDGIPTVQPVGFEVTATGSGTSTGKTITYFLIFLFALIVFSILLVIGIALPSNNKTDEMTGYVIAVSNLKYLKLVSLGLTYIFGMFIAYFAWMLSYAYLDMDFLSDILKFVFYFLVALALPLFILFVWTTITNLMRDSKVHELLYRGFKVKGEM